MPYHVLAKPAGAACNLSCKYCFFLSKEALYQDSSHLMSDATLELYIQQLVEAAGSNVTVSWQGGEPMLRGMDFFQRSIDLVERFRKPWQRILHTIQTNGTLIDDAWTAFFKKNKYLVGLSIDGPRELHDAYRIDKRGAGSFDQTLEGWRQLRRSNVDVNILCTVNARNVAEPLRVYRFFRDDLSARYVQLIPIVERVTSETASEANRGWGGARGSDRPLYKQEGDLITERTVPASQFGAFLVAIYDEWVRRDVGTVFVTTFDVALASWLGQHSVCTVKPTCGDAPVVDQNGNVYSCDHYVEPRYKIGNIREEPLAGLARSDKQKQFGDSKYETLPNYCIECPVLFACYGECPRNRFIKSPSGEDGLNYLCDGYKAFFSHIDADMRVMAQLISTGRFPDEIMGLSQQQKTALLRERPSSVTQPSRAVRLPGSGKPPEIRRTQ